jgi:hypothetical protein
MEVISHWIIQNAIHVVLIVAGVRWISIEDLSDRIDACSGVEAGPEGLLNMFHGIDAQSVNWKR